MTLTALTEANGNPVVQMHEVRNLRLKSGSVVPNARLGFCVYGRDGAPVVILHTAVSGNPKAFVVEKQGYGDGWWSRHFGSGNMFDTSRYRIVCVSHFGGNGPSSTAIELAPWRFDLSILDTCQLTARMLKDLGLDEIHAVIGVSMGAPIAREWLFQSHLRVNKIVEIFGNFGNNHAGAVAKDYCHIQIDLLHSDSGDLDAIRDRIDANCGVMTRETPAFALAYDHIMREYQTLYTAFSDENVLRVTRMIGFFRFVTPYFFQQRWDADFNQTMDSEYADTQLRKMCNQLGETFARTFKRASLASLRFMDAQPCPMEPGLVAEKLVQRDAEILGLIVRGDRLYEPSLQLDHYRRVRAALPCYQQDRAKVHLCTNLLRGHDHFLSEEFRDDGKEIIRFFEKPGSRSSSMCQRFPRRSEKTDA